MDVESKIESVQREFEVFLPIGYTDENCYLHQRAVIRKMRGHEEALLNDPMLGGSALVSEVIKGCLIRLGDLDSVDTGIVAQLYSADRNYLLLEIRRITLGNELREIYLCPRCGNEVELLEDLDKIEVRRLNSGEQLAEISVELDDGYIDRNGALHREITMTYPRGSDEEFVAPMVEKDSMKAQDALILRCIKQFGTLPKATLEAYGVKILRDLTLGDRRRIQKALSENSPGVDFLRIISCSHCGNRFEGVMDVSSFFV